MVVMQWVICVEYLFFCCQIASAPQRLRVYTCSFSVAKIRDCNMDGAPVFSGLLLRRDKGCCGGVLKLCLPKRPSIVNSYRSTVTLNSTALHTQVKFDKRELLQSFEMLIASVFLSLCYVSFLFSFFLRLSPSQSTAKMQWFKNPVEILGHISPTVDCLECFYEPLFSHPCHSAVMYGIISLSMRTLKKIYAHSKICTLPGYDLAIKISQLPEAKER